MAHNFLSINTQAHTILGLLDFKVMVEIIIERLCERFFCDGIPLEVVKSCTGLVAQLEGVGISWVGCRRGKEDVDQALLIFNISF